MTEQNDTNGLLAWVNSRVDTADQHELNIESIKNDLKEAIQATEHTSSRKRLTAVLADWKLNSLLISIALCIILMAIRGWLLFFGSPDLAGFPYDSIEGTTYGGALTVIDPVKFIEVSVLTFLLSAVLGITISMLVAYLSFGLQPFKQSQTSIVPTSPGDHNLSVIYQSGPDRDPQLWLHGEKELISLATNGYASTTEQRSDDATTQPQSVIDETTPDSPQIIVANWTQPNQLPTSNDVSLENKFSFERLIEAVNDIPCRCEAQVIIGSGTKTYTVPSAAAEESKFGITLKRLKQYSQYDDSESTQYSVNIRVVAAPSTDEEFFKAMGVLSSVGLSLPDTPRLDGSIETISPTYRDPRPSSPRIPYLLSVRQWVMHQSGSRSKRQSASSQGIFTWIRCRIQRLADPDSGVSLETAVRERRLRMARDSDVLGTEQTGLVVSQEAVPSLLIARRNYTTALENALQDDINGESLNSANTADFLADATEMDDDDNVASTDGGNRDNDSSDDAWTTESSTETEDSEESEEGT